MKSQHLDKLGAAVVGDVSAHPRDELTSFETRLNVRLPDDYKDLLAEYGGALVFSCGARFRGDQPSPLDGPEGTLALEILYGPTADHNGLYHQNLHRRDELPREFVIIGEAPGGNPICLAQAGPEPGAVFLCDHEAVPQAGYYRISRTWQDFLLRLSPDNDAVSTDGIIESESWLDL